MSQRYRIQHSTEYRYTAQVQAARHLLHLAPRVCPWQNVESATLQITPAIETRVDGIDTFGNPVSRIEFSTPHNAFRVDSTTVVSLAARPWANASGPDPAWGAVRESLAYHAGPVDEDLRQALTMRFESPSVRVKHELELYAAPSFPAGRPVIAATRDLMARIHREFTYDPAATEVGTSVLEVLEQKRGVCQDFAHLMIGCLRGMGLAARYVSGYLRTDPPAGQPRLVGADASHAWVAVFVPDLGWVEFDPTNDCLADQRHIVLAWGRDFSDVSPIRGVIQGGGEHTLKVAVTVMPLDE